MGAYYFECLTAFGWVAVAFSDQGLLAASWPAPSTRAAIAGLSLQEVARATDPGQTWGELVHKLQSYFEGWRVSFAQVPIDWRDVPDFRHQVWSTVQRIPWGATRTCKEVAAAVGAPTASRAVGAAMAGNRLPIIVPCHRVLGSDGRLVGAPGGLEMKARLLALEGIQARQARAPVIVQSP